MVNLQGAYRLGYNDAKESKKSRFPHSKKRKLSFAQEEYEDAYRLGYKEARKDMKISVVRNLLSWIKKISFF